MIDQLTIPRARDFVLASCQATLFTPDEDLSAAKLVRGLLPSWSDRFDADPVVLPAFEALPPEAARIILASKSGHWQCLIGAVRIDLHWRRQKDDEASLDVSEFYRDTAATLQEYRDFLGARVDRLAAVVTRAADHKSPALALAQHFCNEARLTTVLNRPTGFELHAHKVYELDREFSVNSWVRCKSGKRAGGTIPVILVEQDLNTIEPEDPDSNLSNDQLSRFFSAAPREIDSILAAYFPERSSEQ